MDIPADYIKSGTLVNGKFREFLIPTLLMSMSAQLGVVLDGILVSYFIGADAMAGVEACVPVTQMAAALATILGDLAGIAFVLGIYFTARERTFKLMKTFNLDRAISICRAGFPAALGMGLLAIQFWSMYQIVGWAGGTDGATIYAACMLYLTFLSMFADGINQSMLPILGVLYGEKDYTSIRMLMRYVCAFLMKIVLASVIVAMIFPQELLSICRIPDELAAQGANDVRVFSLSFFGVAWTFLMLYYYSAVGQNAAGNLLSMTSGLFVVMPSAWLFANFLGRMGVWLGMIFAGFVGVTALMIYVRRVCAKSDGRLSDFYLIEKNGSELLYDVSLKTTAEDAAKLSRAAGATLENLKLSEKISIKAALALEEITAKLAQLNNKAVDFDVRILNDDDEIILALRDNGVAFSPMEYQPPEDDGIIVLKAVAKEIRYDRVLGLNQTVITIAKNKEG